MKKAMRKFKIPHSFYIFAKSRLMDGTAIALHVREANKSGEEEPLLTYLKITLPG